MYKGSEPSLYEGHHSVKEIEAVWRGGDRTVVPLVNPTILTCEQPDRKREQEVKGEER